MELHTKLVASLVSMYVCMYVRMLLASPCGKLVASGNNCGQSSANIRAILV